MSGQHASTPNIRCWWPSWLADEVYVALSAELFPAPFNLHWFLTCSSGLNKEYASGQLYFNPANHTGVPFVAPWPWVRVCMRVHPRKFLIDQHVTRLDWCRMTWQFFVSLLGYVFSATYYSKETLSQIDRCVFCPGPHSQHCVYSVHLNLWEHTYGGAYWLFN